MHVNLRRLMHNRAELLLTFVVPIVFFSIFAVIFGNGIGSGVTTRIKVVVVDTAETPESHGIVEALNANAGLRLMRTTDPAHRLTVDDARLLVRRGAVTMAIVLRSDQDRISADLLSDVSDQVAGQVGSAIMTQTMMQVHAMQRGEPHTQTRWVASPGVFAEHPSASASAAPGRKAAAILGQNLAKPEVQPTPRLPSVDLVDVMAEGKANPVVSMYAAGIAVMFLLFGATSGGGALLEERERQTLDRLLCTSLTMDQLLLGKWFYLTALGVLQVSVMFLWGQFVFGIDLLGHLDGFLMITVVTAAAASAFGLFLGTLCRTRGQLNGLSVVLVLTMSALGGSMVPRYVMSDSLQQFGLWTFNAWALDGYNKVFWRELPVAALAPQLAVLMVCGVGFLMAARVLALRWEHD